MLSTYVNMGGRGLCLIGMLLSLTSCATSDASSQYSKHTGVYSESGATNKEMMEKVERDCPNGYQQIDLDHEDILDWHIDVVCKKPAH